MKKITALLLMAGFVLSTMFFQGCNKTEDAVTPDDDAISLGVLVLNPSAFLANVSTEVLVRLQVPANVQVADSIVKLVRLDNDNKVVQELGNLIDNGVLGNGDEILGDNVFSGIFNISLPTGNHKLQVTGKVKKDDKTINGASNVITVSVFTDFSSQELTQLLTVQSNGATQFDQFLNNNQSNLPNAVQQLKTWLESQAGVQSVSTAGETSIEILYTSGVYGGLVFQVEDETGSIVTRGGAPQVDERKSRRTIPLKSQTRGTIEESKIPGRTFKPSDLDPKLIGNRNVLIYAPFESAFAPHNEAQNIMNNLNTSDFKFEIRHLSNEAADISSLSNLTDYGFVILATHGSQGKAFSTGEVVDTNSAKYQSTYKAMLKANKLAIWKNIVVKKNGSTNVKADVYAIRFPFISDLAGKFPNSVILNNSCESTMNSDLENAFIGKGAKTYYGYSKIVSSKFCVERADTVSRRLAKELKTTGESFLAGNDPYSTHNAAFQLKGANDVRYPDDLINGDFEFGKIDGWTKSGDGRVISKLGTVGPTQPNFMGIISTGLGFTEATGSIFQTFTVRENQNTLTVKWNFLSEEFLEYINSQFQDYFEIKIRKKDGTETVLLSKTIDQIAADFGATQEMPGNLISVSPGIVFDQGGVYMTNWQMNTFDISAFKGQRITLILGAGDVGDSIYDTAILLDEVSIQ